MFLKTASPRRSFTVPININLQGARRRQARDLLQTTPQELDWSRGPDWRGGGPRTRTLTQVSSVGEDRAVLLGFTMMAFSVLMFFVVGITMVQPYVSSNWTEVSCVLLSTEVLQEWVDCRGVSTVPCLRVKVNLTSSNQTAFLHLDEELVLLALECFYIPKCRMDRAELQEEVEKVQKSLDNQLESASSCLSDAAAHPGEAVLRRKYGRGDTLFALLWPGLMLGGGALLVGLVKLTQVLAHLAAEARCEAPGVKLTSRLTRGKLYRLLQRHGSQSPS
ncbi:calcium-activated potassium channel subunit beta-3 [Antennarius striatus]|uniref:calcium-activated potassium channel subunit beta-3 n=1 Tax=Antennarius striatus TaxID=241820 RepID=UPI0035B1A24A